MHSIIYLTSSIPKKSADFSGAPLHFSRSAGSARLRVRRHRPAFRIVSAGRIRCFPKKSADFSGAPLHFSRSAGSARLRVRRHRPAFRIVSAGRIRCFPKKSADFSGAPFLFQIYYTISTGKRKTFACATLRRLKQKGEAPYLSLSGARGATHTFPHLWGSSFIHALPFWRSLHSAHAPAPPLWQTTPLHCQGM